MVSVVQSFQNQRKRGRLIDSLLNDDERVPQLVQQEDAFNRQVLIVGLTGTAGVLSIFGGGQILALAGLGYLGLLALHYSVPPRESYRKYTRDALILNTGFSFVGYFATQGVTAAAFSYPLGVAVKLVELSLISVLWADARNPALLDLLTRETAPAAAPAPEMPPVANAPDEDDDAGSSLERQPNPLSTQERRRAVLFR
ncbi:MAG: hypothetical protein GYB67_16030 [Chloroflexi bacterium]|nr:hypothetical protein [Chloroflexota bacterium]